jgi:hypothetical protein
LEFNFSLNKKKKNNTFPTIPSNECAFILFFESEESEDEDDSDAESEAEEDNSEDSGTVN